MIKIDLKVKLSEILANVDNQYYWVLHDLEVMGIHVEKSTDYDIEQQVLQSEFGLPITFVELLEFEDRFTQIFDMILVGNEKQINQTINEAIEDCDIYIELFDSSYWEITSKDRLFLDKMEKLKEKY